MEASRDTATVGAMDERSYKRFAGEEDDPGKGLKKWRAWALAKMATMPNLAKNQRGPWVFTLLDGKALEACEHVSQMGSEAGM